MVSVGYLREIGLLDLHSEAPKPRAPLPAAAVAAAPSEPVPAPAAAGAAKGGKAGKAAEGAAGAPAPASAGDAPAGPPPEELSPEELKKLSKSERTAYYAARRAGGQTPAPKAKQLSKAERRAVQEAQRKVKEDKQSAAMDNAEMLEELKLQGLSEEQAREVMAELLRTEEEQAADEEEDDEPEDLLSSVRKWMSEQDKVPEDALHDFNMKVRFQGHVDTTPPDHLAAILQTITEEACRQCDLKTPKPNAVAKTVEPAVVRWAPLLEPLYAKIGDPMEAADVVVRAVQEGVGALGEVPEAGQACGVVGCLMALREIDMIEDEDLLTGCRRCEPHSRVMEKFIEFLEEELEDEDEEDDGED